MNTNVNLDPANSTTATKPKAGGKRAAFAAALLVSGGLALSGLGLAAAAQAAPGPAPQAPSSINAGFAEHHHHHHHFGDARPSPTSSTEVHCRTARGRKTKPSYPRKPATSRRSATICATRGRLCWTSRPYI
jgi:hypothetical protein